MTDQKKGRADCHQTTFNTAFGKRYFTRLASLLKALILTLALWGWVPVGLADWLIHRGESHDE